MTTSQLVAVTATAERTVTYRLGRLSRGGFIESTRPYVASGSSPLHWWLKPRGIEAVTGSRTLRRGESCRPKPMFLAHTAAIASLWTALVVEGPSVGLVLTNWKRDEDGWEDWASGGWPQRERSGRLTPDAVATFSVDGFAVDVFIEVDLATMTQRRLRHKAFRYLTYADSGAWKSLHGTCPSLLLLTTSEARTTAFLAAVEKLAADDRVVDDDVAGQLLVSGCASVLDMGTAVTERVWRKQANGDDFSFAELLIPHVEAERAKIHEAEARARYEDHISPITTMESIDYIARLIRSSTRGAPGHPRNLCDAFDVLVDELKSKTDQERDAWAMSHRRFMNVLRDWAVLGTKNEDAIRPCHVPMSQDLKVELQAMLDKVRAKQRRHVETANQARLFGEPMLRVVLERMANGEVISPRALGYLDEPRDGVALQQQAYGSEYLRIRAETLGHLKERQSRRERRNFDEQAWLDDFDAQWLLICQACLIKVPKDHRGGRYCEYCDSTRQLVALSTHLELPGEHDTLLRNGRSLGQAEYRTGW